MTNTPTPFDTSDAKIAEGFETLKQMITSVEGDIIRPSLAKKIAKSMGTYLGKFEERLTSASVVFNFSGPGETKEVLKDLIQQVQNSRDKQKVLELLEEFHKKMVDILLILSVQSGR